MKGYSKVESPFGFLNIAKRALRGIIPPDKKSPRNP